MDLSTLKYAKGSRKPRKRVGRGGAHGKTSGRGDKGQRSRSGSKKRLWFEGGQMPIQRRVPKRGFHNINRIEYQVINVGDLEKMENIEEINPDVLYDHGYAHKRKPIKILGQGEVKKKLSVAAHAFSQTAKTKIESAGGRTSVL